jgi:hypothetical protein
MEICPRCKRTDVEFGSRTKNGKVTRQPYCRECNKAYHKEHYSANKKRYIENSKVRKDGLYLAFLEYLRDKVCSDCGISDPRVLEFDHRDPTEKTLEVSILVRRAGKKKLNEEIAKCDIVCCNCHRIRTLTRMNSKRLALLP